MDEALKLYLADRDAGCPSCGYNLRALTTDVCPECRRRIELRLDEDYAARRWLPLTYWTLGIMIFLSAVTVVTTVYYAIAYSGQMRTGGMIAYYAPRTVSALAFAVVCIVALVKIRRIRAIGKGLLRAYVVCVVAMLVGTVLAVVEWIVSMILAFAASTFGW